ncbi:hypothetical protein E3N88_16063 [Mikania micrantha]|uniref:Uncharacterized protein n=1 Tax=Mikania micrantha TaxID=192012 RepID=A0A5N6NZG6_9ASTR|nr:hypothetical protein E3N88_16063 [Mikania micrantha]
MIIPGAILSFKSLENEDWMVVYVCSSSGLRNRSKKKKIISSCMNSDEIDQTSAPPHPSRTATRSPKRLRVPRRNPEISDFYRASRTAENLQAHLRNVLRKTPSSEEYLEKPMLPKIMYRKSITSEGNLASEV